MWLVLSENPKKCRRKIFLFFLPQDFTHIYSEIWSQPTPFPSSKFSFLSPNSASMCSALNGHLYQPPKPSGLKERFGRGGKKNVRPGGQGGGLWTAVLCMWHGCWTRELTAPVVACPRPACSLSLPECRGRGKSPKPCDEGKILQTREVVDKLFLLYIKYSIKSNSQKCKKNYTRQLNGYSRQKTIPPIHPTSEVAKKNTWSHQLAKKKASEKNSRLILD